MQSFSEGVRRCLIIFLIEESFAHAEIGKWAAGLDAERFLVLCHGVVEFALLREIFAASNGGASAEGRAGFKDNVVGVDFDSKRLGAAENVD